jgi:hypothetical protein
LVNSGISIAKERPKITSTVLKCYSWQTCLNITTRHFQIISHIFSNNGIYHMDIFKIVPLFNTCDRYTSLLVTQYSEPFQQVCCDCHGCVAVKLALDEELEEWDAALQ